MQHVLGPDDRALRPLLLLDVDGVLNPLSLSPPPGYSTEKIGDYEVAISARHAGWLLELGERTEIVWATTWEESANVSVGPLLGLPVLPVINFDEGRAGGTWKLPAVRRYVGDRSAIWIDDELFDDAQEWAAGRSAPTLLIRPAASVGLVERHMDEIRNFLAREMPVESRPDRGQ